MTQSATSTLSTIWPLIGALGTLRTPSDRAAFAITEVSDDQLKVAVGESYLSIPKAAFEAALTYLHAQGHDEGKPCPINANNSPNKAGPLCLATRRQPSGSYGARNITYILPILAHFGIVVIDRQNPSTVWLTDAQVRLTTDQQAFADYLSRSWDEADSGFSHQYRVSRHRVWSAWRAQGKGDIWWCSSLSQAALHYAWPENDAPGNFASLSLKLRQALDDNDNALALALCKDIFRWGGVARKASDPSLRWVSAQAEAGTLCEAILRAVALLQPRCSLTLHAFDGTTLLMNSAMTKVYAAADPANIIMYDGRVGAALGLLTRNWLSATQHQQVPHDLAFRWGPSIKTASNTRETRNPSEEGYRFSSLYTASNDQAQRWAELVRQSSRILREVLRTVACEGSTITLTDLERALFMVGYDVRWNGER